MAKKINLILAALAALAFAIPGVAGASTGLTEEGALVPVGKKITGTSIGTPTVISSKFGELKCKKVTLNGEVKVNNATSGVEGVGVGFGTTSECTLKNGKSFIVDELQLVNIKSPANTPGKGTASFTFKATLPEEQICIFHGFDAPGTYTANTDILKLSGAPLTVTGANCGTASLNAEFTLETTGTSTPTIIM